MVSTYPRLFLLDSINYVVSQCLLKQFCILLLYKRLPVRETIKNEGVSFGHCPMHPVKFSNIKGSFKSNLIILCHDYSYSPQIFFFSGF